jgi:diacylglycerol kinase family enzyme
VASCMKLDLLAVVTMKPMSLWKMLKLIFYGLSGRLENAESLESFCADSLTIHTRGKTHTVALDGEMFKMTAPLKIEALPKTLKLILPPLEQKS